MIPHDTTAIPHGSCSPTTGIIKTVQTLQFVLQKPRHRTNNPPNLISNHTRWSHHVPCIVFFHFAMCPYTLQYTPQCFFILFHDVPYVFALLSPSFSHRSSLFPVFFALGNQHFLSGKPLLDVEVVREEATQGRSGRGTREPRPRWSHTDGCHVAWGTSSTLTQP